MAVDKLVDSSKLNAALDYEASKIIAKGGGTAPLAFDFANEKGFGDYIDAIPSGGGYTEEDILLGNALTGEQTITMSKDVPSYYILGQHGISKLTINLNGYSFGTAGYNIQQNGVSSYIVNGNISPYLPAYAMIGDGSKDYIVVIKGTCPRFMQYALRDTRITLLDFTYNGAGANQGFEANAFGNNSHKLSTIIIRGNTVFPLKNTNVFTQLNPWKDGGTGGTLYVPQALISAYESASNWSTILGYSNNQILKIEESIYDGYYADGTPIPTT